MQIFNKLSFVFFLFTIWFSFNSYAGLFSSGNKPKGTCVPKTAKASKDGAAAACAKKGRAGCAVSPSCKWQAPPAGATTAPGPQTSRFSKVGSSIGSGTCAPKEDLAEKCNALFDTKNQCGGSCRTQGTGDETACVPNPALINTCASKGQVPCKVSKECFWTKAETVGSCVAKDTTKYNTECENRFTTKQKCTRNCILQAGKCVFDTRHNAQCPSKKWAACKLSRYCEWKRSGAGAPASAEPAVAE